MESWLSSPSSFASTNTSDVSDSKNNNSKDTPVENKPQFPLFPVSKGFRLSVERELKKIKEIAEKSI